MSTGGCRRVDPSGSRVVCSTPRPTDRVSSAAPITQIAFDRRDCGDRGCTAAPITQIADAPRDFGDRGCSEPPGPHMPPLQPAGKWPRLKATKSMRGTDCTHLVLTSLEASLNVLAIDKKARRPSGVPSCLVAKSGSQAPGLLRRLHHRAPNAPQIAHFCEYPQPGSNRRSPP